MHVITEQHPKHHFSKSRGNNNDYTTGRSMLFQRRMSYDKESKIERKRMPPRQLMDVRLHTENPCTPNVQLSVCERNIE